MFAGGGEGIELGAAIVLGNLPIGFDGAFLFEFVKGRVERTVTDLQNFAGNLTEPLADGETVERFEGKDFEKEEVEGALYEIGGFAHIGNQG